VRASPIAAVSGQAPVVLSAERVMAGQHGSQLASALRVMQGNFAVLSFSPPMSAPAPEATSVALRHTLRELYVQHALTALRPGLCREWLVAEAALG